MAEAMEKLSPSQVIAKPTRKLAKSLIHNGAKLKPRVVIKDVKEDPEIQSETIKHKDVTKN